MVEGLAVIRNTQCKAYQHLSMNPSRKTAFQAGSNFYKEHGGLALPEPGSESC